MLRLTYIHTPCPLAQAAHRHRRPVCVPARIQHVRRRGTPKEPASGITADRSNAIPRAPSEPPLNLVLRLQCREEPIAPKYLIRLFDAKTGQLQSHFVRHSFEGAVQLVRYCLPMSDDYYIAATWKQQIGRLAVSTPEGLVLARIGPVNEQAAVDLPVASQSAALVTA